jgi:ribA/ribD-fused uncharacterized protein
MKPPFPTGTIDKFFPNTPFYIYSNFYPSSVNLDGLTFITVEHAYQAAKTEDTTIRSLIMQEPTAARAKRRGNAIKLRENWDYIKFDIMHKLLLQKFAKGTDLANKLKSTRDALMIEGNYWHDLCWGQCFCATHKWEGSNRLGGMLMAIREDL